MNRKEILEIFDNYENFVLSTIGLDASIQSRAVINIRNKNIAPNLQMFFSKNDKIIIITNMHSDKVKQIKQNNTASVYAYTPQYSSLLISGTISEITDTDLKNSIWDDSFLKFYPTGRDGGDFTALEFSPNKFKRYSNFQLLNGEISE